MRITKALIIADPWIEYILDGSKTWEMRSKSTSYQGWIGLIGKGTGKVKGIAELVGVGSPLSPSEMIATFRHHRIPEETLLSKQAARWNVPWMLANVERLSSPIPYRHRTGAVVWINLDTDVSESISSQIYNRTNAI